MNSRKPRKADSCKPFITWVLKQVREHKWSLDACCGYAKKDHYCGQRQRVCRFRTDRGMGSKVFFAHPYTSWERAQNERHNGLFRALVPKGVSIELFTDEDILAAADELNGRPRRKLGTVPRRNSLRYSWILFTQSDGYASPAHGQSLRLHP